MSEAKHTPGPWSHHVDIACKCGGIGSKNHPVAKVYAGEWGDEYPAIRLVGGSLERQYEAYIERIAYGEIPQAEADANAALISAAPDLLEALKNLVAIYDDEFGIVAPEMDAARAAIAKAQPSETASGKER